VKRIFGSFDSPRPKRLNVIKSRAVADRTVENFMPEWNLMSHGNASDDEHFMALAIAEAEKDDNRPGAGEVGSGGVIQSALGRSDVGGGDFVFVRADRGASIKESIANIISEGCPNCG
jgi:hypothetical protein